MIQSFEGRSPTVPATAHVEESAILIGDVVLGDRASVWFGAVVRADIQRIEIGARTNVQDLCVLHVTEEFAVHLAEDVTLGHRVTVHGARIGARTLLGIGCIVLDGAEVGEDCLVAAGAVVTPGTRVPSGSLVAGVPGRVVRPLTAAELEKIRIPARNYLGYQERYRKERAAR